MNKKLTPAKKKTNQPQKKRYTIGLLTDFLTSSYIVEVLRGAQEYTQAEDINLLCFAGGGIDSPYEYGGQGNAIYDLVGAQNVDGIVAASGVLITYANADRLEALYQSFGVPVVSLGVVMDSFPSVISENYTGLHSAMIHLVQDHGYRRIVFIKGPEEHQEAEARYEAYCDALTEAGLSIDPALILPGDFREPRGHELVSRLLNENGANFDAIVAANDDMAFGALSALQEYGLRVPYDVAVVGFDNLARSKYVLPPLTTVQQPIRQLGIEGIKVLLAQLNGEAVSEKVILPSELVLRQSCGCTTSTVAEAALTSIEMPDKIDLVNKDEALEVAVFQQREEILSQMRQAAGDITGLRSDWAERLLDSFWAALTTPSSDEALDDFIPILDETLHEVVIHRNNISSWQSVISAMRRQIRPYLQGKELAQAEDIWQQARVVVGEIAHWMPSYLAQQAERRAEILRYLSANVISAFDVDELMNALAEYLPRLGMAGCYLSLYEDPQNHTEMSRLMLAFNENDRIEIEPDGQLFPTRQLVPDNILSPAARYSFIIVPLFFQKERLGFVLFTTDQPEEVVYETLRAEISSALQGALLMKQEEKRVRQLQTVTQLSTTTSTILDTADLLQQVVDLTKEQFELYHAHIYLLNEAGNTLKLAAGAGKAGREMLAKAWRIPLMRKQSLVARAARNREGIIVDDVKQEPDWLSNPLLPDTRSELAVPMIAGDRVLGVLDVQSDKIGHFTEEDVRIQTTLAAQVAATLQNARLFTEMAQRATEQEALSEISQQLTTALDPQQLITDVVEQVGTAFNYYYTQIYLFDQDQANLVLASGTGQVGEMLVARQHSLPKGRGLVGRAAQQKKNILVPNVQRHIGAEIVTPANLEEIYQREVDEATEIEWYTQYITEHFGDVEVLKDWLEVYPDSDGKVLKLGYVTLTPGSFSGMLRRGVEAVARDLQVAVEFVSPPQEGENLPLFEKMVAKKVDGLVVIPDGPSWAEPINKGLETGIPIVTANRDFHNSPALMHVGVDDFAAGVMLARQLISLLQAQNRHTGKILVGIRNSDRTAGVRHGLRRTNYNVVEIEGFVKEAEALENLWQKALDRHSDLVAVMGLSTFEMPTLINLKRRRQGQWLLVGFDLEEITLEALRDNVVQVAIGQHPYLQGYLPILALVEHLRQSRPLSGWMAEGWLPNVLLPETKAEVAVPIASGNQILGVLDVQHNVVGGLQRENANLLRSVADQVAIALTNARLFEETQVTLNETSALYQASRQVNEANTLNEMMVAIAEASENTNVNQILLTIFEHNTAGQVDSLAVTARWFSGQGTSLPSEGTHLSLDKIPYKNLMFSPEPIFIDDVLHDERLDFEAIAAIQQTHIQAMAILPLWIGDRQIGVLLLRAEEVHRFTQSEKRLYASLARQVAVAVENQQLLAETQSVLAELEATQRRYTIQAWDTYRQKSPTLNYEQVRYAEDSQAKGMPPDQQDVLLLADGGESTSPANGSGQDDTSLPTLTTEPENGLVVPLKVRGEEIGVLGIAETDGQRTWSPEEVALVEAIAEQVAQAAENLRLIDETQQAAARETRVNEIGEKIQSAQSLEEALRIAVKEVGLSLKVPQTAVQLKVRD